MLVSEILKAKGAQVHSVAPSTTLRAAIRVLCEHHIGSLLVMAKNGHGPHPVGIITERDLLRQCDQGADLDQIQVHQAMATDLIIGLTTDDVQQAMSTMTERRVRHLPIVDGETGRIAGMLSIGDVVNALRHDEAAAVRYLHDYIRLF